MMLWTGEKASDELIRLLENRYDIDGGEQSRARVSAGDHIVVFIS